MPFSSTTIAQYVGHGSLNGIFYFFGERSFSSATPGIANAAINGTLVLRPYATFSHPNVLAGFLVVSMSLLLLFSDFKKQKLQKLFFTAVLLVGTVALFATLSRIAIFAWGIIFIIWIFQKNHLPAVLQKFLFSQARVILFFILLVCGIVLVSNTFFPVFSRFSTLSLTDESFVQREVLNSSAWHMFASHPVFGVGLNNFLVNLPNFITPKTVFYLQPVHNIFLLVLSETGIVGFFFFIWFLVLTFRNIKYQIAKIKKNNQKINMKNKFIIFFLVLFLGLFDHYFLTLQQGQLLFSFVLGFCWAKNIS